MFAVLIFLLAIILANLSVTYFGPISSPFNAFILIGLDLSLRDYIHERWHNKHLGLKMLILIIAGAIITYLLNRNAGMVCIGSIIAFGGALVADAIIYEKLFHEVKLFKMNVSNIGSAMTDSILFPTIAFGVFMPWIILSQFLAKTIGGFLWSLLLIRNFINND